MCIQGKRMEADLEAMPTRGRIIHWELGDGCQGDCEPEDAEAQPGSRVACLQECAPIGTHCLTAAESARSQAQRQRSVPAGAGEPQPPVPGTPALPVCPRGCGGTRVGAGERHPPGGLSPRVRGNHRLEPPQPANEGSIPAGAGEPAPPAGLPVRVEVYPRGCGGTVYTRHVSSQSSGLSPRVRGNQTPHRSLPDIVRSIPAGAGEPSRPRAPLPSKGVYPRGCGGTHAPDWKRHLFSGLSPRVRGNPAGRSRGCR